MGWNPISSVEVNRRKLNPKQAKRAVSKIVNPAVDAGKTGRQPVC